MHPTLRYLIAFLLLMLLMQEAHEIAHLLTDKLVGGCGGTRYFMYLDLCEASSTAKVITTALAGPFITYLFMWIGYFMLAGNPSLRQKSWGFTLIMAAVPLSRMQSLVLRGGDELLSFRRMLEPNPPFKGAAMIVGSLLILLATVPPLWRAFKNTGHKNRILTFAAFLILPYIIVDVLQKLLLKPGMKVTLLESPLGSQSLTWLVLIDIALLVFFVLTYRSIAALFRQR